MKRLCASSRNLDLALYRNAILVNTPGVTTADMSTFTYHHRRIPLYPMELDAEYGIG